MSVFVYSSRGSCSYSAAMARKWLPAVMGRSRSDSHIIHNLSDLPISPSASKEKNHKVLCIAGGEGKHVLNAIRKDAKGVDHIKNFVRQGGTFFGICCGAYIACRWVRFDGRPPVPGLALVPCDSIGPLYKHDDYAPFEINDRRNATSVVVRYEVEGRMEPKESAAYLHGGGTFVHAGNPVPSKGVYSHSGLPSTVMYRLGVGRVVLTGIHPEHPDSSCSDHFARVLMSDAKL